MNKGQISPILLWAMSGFAGITVAYGGWVGVSLNETSTKVQVVEERERNHYEEIDKKLTTIDEKLDKLISSSGKLK